MGKECIIFPMQKKSFFKALPSLLLVVGLLVFCLIYRSSFHNLEMPVLVYSVLGASLVLFVFLSLFSIRLPDKIGKVFPYILFFLAPLFSIAAVEYLNGNFLWDINYFVNVVMNYLLALWVYFLVFALTSSFRHSIRFTSIFLLCFGIANYYVKMYKGAPLLPWDFASLGTAKGVASSYAYPINQEIIVSIALTAALWKLTGLITKEEDHRKNIFHLYLRIISCVIAAGFPVFFYMTDVVAKDFGATPDFFNQTRGYENNGAIAEFMVNTRYLKLHKPKNYAPDKVETLMKEGTDEDAPSITETALKANGYDYHKPADVKNPNIVVIMNESFSDLSVIGDFDTNEEVMPNINAMRNEKNVIEGNSYVSTIGTGTSNTEYEFLTNNSMTFLPAGSNAYQLYVNHTQPSLVSTLKSMGYIADVMHPYYKDDWNRPAVYKDMGFDSFEAIEDMTMPEKIRLFVSDAWDFGEIRRMYENRDTSQPYFLFNITMQNHSSYEKTYSNFPQKITLENMKGSYPLTEQYLSLIHQTDEDFKNLIDYFKTVKEPTIVLMFGDHQPFIEDSFYEEIMGSSLSKMDDETQQKRYITRFILWANYDIPEGWIDEISVNYLSTLLSENANIPLTDYNKFLETLYTKYPVITQLGCRNTEDQYMKYNEQEDLLPYASIAYNNLMEDDKRKNNLFYLKKKKMNNN